MGRGKIIHKFLKAVLCLTHVSVYTHTHAYTDRHNVRQEEEGKEEGSRKEGGRKKGGKEEGRREEACMGKKVREGG